MVSSYFIGSIPWGLIISSKFYRTDLRQHGSGNIGFTNAFRILGPIGGAIIFAGDFSKGLFSVLLAKSLGAPDYILVLSGLAAILGHNWSIFLRFSGGRGVSTAAGVILALTPAIVAILLAIWLVVLALSRYVSLASISVALAFPMLMLYFFSNHPWHVAFSLLASLVVILKHRPNIKRLLAGNELRISFGPKKEDTLGS